MEQTVKMPKKYPSPKVYPTVGEHPRLLFNTKNKQLIKCAFENDEKRRGAIFSYAKEYDSGVLGEVIDHPSSSSHGPRGRHNLNEEVLEVLIYKAFLYQMTSDEIAGRDAIRMITEYMTTMRIEGGVGDPERNFGFAMFAAAIVYDWCYDLMSRGERVEMINTVANVVCAGKNMEVGFPPEKQNAVCGHGSERQILRDYLSFSLAIYDEEPSWYEFVGGRFFEEYVPVRNEYYKAGMYPQGVSTYIQIRFTSDLWSAWIMKSATGVIPYDEAMKEILPSLFNRIVDGDSTLFMEGDDGLSQHINILYGLSFASSICAYLFGDPRTAAWAKHLNYKYSANLYILILRSTGVDESRDRFEGLDLIKYNGGFLNEIVAHNGRSADSASVLMKIGGRTTANHDHGDAGSFQIYYKGILAGDTGVYDSYGTRHHYKYHQATVAHNAILLYRDGKSYGQRGHYEPESLLEWLSDEYKSAELSGVSVGYKDANGTLPSYAYIAGDVSFQYEENAIKKADRRMLTVLDSEGAKIPAYLFVFDRITAQRGEDRKAFLLHTKGEPTVMDNTVIATCGGGKLVLQSMLGGDDIIKIGGAGRNFDLDGEQLPTRDGSDDGYWGRIEISPKTTSKTDTLLNVLYATDADNDTIDKAELVTGDGIVGALIGDSCAIFSEKYERRITPISFTTAGEGDLTYYVSGVKAGEWQVRVDATTLSVTAAEESGLLTFTAPRGAITITLAN